MPCYVQLGNETGFPHKGVIDFVDNHVDQTTGTMRIRGVLKNESGKLIPGLFARLTVPGSGRYHAILVPDTAIGNDQSQQNVLVVDKDNKVAVRPVTLGALFGGLRSIVSGIRADDRIVVNGQMHARPGSAVTPIETPIKVDEADFSDPGEEVAAATSASRRTTCRGPSRAATRSTRPRAKRANEICFLFHRPTGLRRGAFDRDVIVGAISCFTLPIAQYPEIAPPTVTVSASYPGANAKTVAETVATPIEEQINGVEGMIYMSSQSTNDGNMLLTVTFKLGTDLDIAQVQVQNRVAIAQPVLPFDVQHAGIVVKKASPNITLGIAVYSPDESRDPLYVSNYVTLQIKDELARLPGVGDLTIFGARDYSMRLWLNPEQLASRHMTRWRRDYRGAGAESASGGRHRRRTAAAGR